MDNRETRTGSSNSVIMWVVVIIVGAGLLVLLMSPVGGAREKARRVNCLSNLKQFGLGLAMYAEEFQGRMPVDSADPTLAGSLRLLEHILTNPRIAACPSASADKKVRQLQEWSQLAPTYISYSYVPNLIWNTNSNTVVMLDKIASTRKGSKWPAYSNHANADGEPAGGNVLFADGHVSWFLNLPADLKDKDGVERVLNP